MKVNLTTALCLSAVSLYSFAAHNRAAEDNGSIDLSGKWEVALPEAANDGVISLPGTTDMAGYGTPMDTSSLSRDE